MKHKQVVVSVSLPLSTVTIAQLATDRYATSMIQLHAFAVCRILEPWGRCGEYACVSVKELVTGPRVVKESEKDMSQLVPESTQAQAVLMR